MPSISATTMPTRAAIPTREGGTRPFGASALLILYAALLWPALAGGAHGGWPLVITELLVLVGLLAWWLAMADAGQLEWCPTTLDKPLALLVALVLLQLVIGNGPLREWALAPPGPAVFPARFLFLGTVAPSQTARSLLLLLGYAGVYLLVVNLVRQRQQLDRLVRILLASGAVLAFLSIVEYLLRESWIFRWRSGPVTPRLTGPFVNPDHWASWLVMLLCLGVGYLAGRRSSEYEPLPGEIVTARRSREGTVQQYLPLLGLMLIALAVVLTLSRGAFLAVLAAGVLLLVSLSRLRRRTWVLALAGALGIVTIIYALWIGGDPLLARLAHVEQVGRLEQWRSSFPMLGTFPLLGVGLGAYKDIYFRFQPVALLPGRVYFPYAHSDLLQFAIEMGPAGVAIALWAIWRVARDLVGAHLLGRGSCPMAAAGHPRRSDPFSVGIMLGGLAAVVALGAHSAVDFSARIPADGLLGAACLGIATVAAHTRFGIDGARPLVDIHRASLGGGRRWRGAAGGLAVLLGACGIPAIVKQARADTVTAPGPELQVEPERQLWTTLIAPGGNPRAAERRSLGDGGPAQLRRDIAATPSDPYLHERLAWALDLQAAMDPSGSRTVREAALTHMQRAVALQPASALLRRSLAALFLAAPAPQLDQAIEAGRAAGERDPALSGSLVEMVAPFTPTDAQWTALAPPDAVDRAELARELEARGFLREARILYERALEGASRGDATVIRWMLAELLLRMQRPSDAVAQTEAALALSPRNPELLLVRARALGMARSPGRLDAYREAAASASNRRGPVFTAQSLRLQTVANDRLGDAARVTPARYRSALAQRLTDEQLWGQARDEWEHLKADGRLDGAGEFSLGLALESTGDRDGALEAFRQAVVLEPSRTSAHAHLASLLWSREQYMQAIAEWQTVTGQQPGDVEAGLALARAYLKVGDRLHALAEYRRLLALSPVLPEAKQAVARLEQKP